MEKTLRSPHARRPGDDSRRRKEADYDKVTEGYWTNLLGGAQPGVADRVRSDMKKLPRAPSMDDFLKTVQ